MKSILIAVMCLASVLSAHAGEMKDVAEKAAEEWVAAVLADRAMTEDCSGEGCAVSADEEPEWQDYVLRVITAEGGTDKAVCAGVTQALYNACEREGWKYTPKEIMRKYRYTGPAAWVSDEAAQAYDEIFGCGYTYSDFGNATVFYAPRYGWSAYHESQRFIIEVNGVRFFEEAGT